jgi:hypothetical protein
MVSFQTAQLVFIAVAGVGMAVIVMGVALLMLLLGERSGWLGHVSLLGRFVLRMALATGCTSVFVLVWLVAWFINRDAWREPLIFTVAFVLTAIALYIAYPRVTPELVATLKRHTSNERVSSS